MKSIDFHNLVKDYLSDEDRKIPKAHLSNVCKSNQCDETCRYIGLGVLGFVCAKNTPVKATLDNLVKEGLFKAKGDNCEGFGVNLTGKTNG